MGNSRNIFLRAKYFSMNSYGNNKKRKTKIEIFYKNASSDPIEVAFNELMKLM